MNPLRIAVIDTPKDFPKEGLVLYANPDFPSTYTDENGITRIDGNTYYAIMPSGAEIVRQRFSYPSLQSWYGITFDDEYDYWYNYGTRIAPQIQYEFLSFSGFTNDGICGGLLYGGTGNTYLTISTTNKILSIVDDTIIAAQNFGPIMDVFFNFPNNNPTNLRNNYGDTAFSGIWSLGMEVQRSQGNSGTTGASVLVINGNIISQNTFLLPQGRRFMGIARDINPFNTLTNQSANYAPLYNFAIYFNGNEITSFEFKKGITIGYVSNAWIGATLSESPIFIPNESWSTNGNSGYVLDPATPLNAGSTLLGAHNQLPFKNKGYLKAKNVPFSIPGTFIAVVGINNEKNATFYPFLGVQQSQAGTSNHTVFPAVLCYLIKSSNQEQIFNFKPDGTVLSSLLQALTPNNGWYMVWQRIEKTAGNTYTSSIGATPLISTSIPYGSSSFNYTGITGGTCDINFNSYPGLNNYVNDTKIGTFLSYNRALSDTEIRDIFRILSSRYVNRPVGLT
jgi:hypothetical protein